MSMGGAHAKMQQSMVVAMGDSMAEKIKGIRQILTKSSAGDKSL